jgi:UDP-N-acetylglucosamine/UDP-N-acetylgalactosamine diphosphorylase
MEHSVFKGQPQLLAGIQRLPPLELASFLKQVENYGGALAKQQKELVLAPRTFSHLEGAPYDRFARSGNVEDGLRGQALVREGKVGCLILAGGQGTRLGVDGPKGAVPILGEKSLFQLFCERTQEASLGAKKRLPLCIMTSACNHLQTVDFFKTHHFFGLDPAQVSFFVQGMLPLLDDCGDWMLERPGKIAEGPDGNGHALRLFVETGIWAEWRAQGIEYLNVIFVDNALADPFDFEFVGFTARKEVDAALKAVDRLFQEEKMGALVQREGAFRVVEYSEISKSSFPLTLSSTGMFCIAMEFIAHVFSEEFPLHLARKSAQVLVSDVQAKRDVWKCERFLFDLLNHTRSSAVLVYPRDKIYAPLKNATGESSFETVRKALSAVLLYKPVI